MALLLQTIETTDETRNELTLAYKLSDDVDAQWFALRGSNFKSASDTHVHISRYILYAPTYDIYPIAKA